MGQVAAAYYSVIFHDMHNMDIRIAWVSGEAPFARIVETDGQGRPTVADVLITAETDWFWDPTPFEDEEFEMFPKLYRDAHLPSRPRPSMATSRRSSRSVTTEPDLVSMS
ncbi:MAG: hypothetical protein R2849_04490 [Thermomicrobiales bacterium]